MSFKHFVLSLFALFSINCATPTQNAPFTAERTISEIRGGSATSRMAFAYQYRIVKVVTVHNPLNKTVETIVFCPGNIFNGKSYYEDTLKPFAEDRFLVDLNSADEGVNVCYVQNWNMVEK